MSKSEEIIQDWHEAKKILEERFPYDHNGDKSLTKLVEIAIGYVDDLGDRVIAKKFK